MPAWRQSPSRFHPLLGVQCVFRHVRHLYLHGVADFAIGLLHAWFRRGWPGADPGCPGGGGLLALVNLVALALLGKVVLRLIDDYDQQRKAGVQIPVFDASQFRDLDLDPRAWPEGDQVAAEGGSETRMPQAL